MPTIDAITSELEGVGISEHDARVIADCVVSRKSCSWVNTDHVDDKLLQDLDALIKKNNYGIKVDIEPVPTRSKFIWEVKVLS